MAGQRSVWLRSLTDTPSLLTYSFTASIVVVLNLTRELKGNNATLHYYQCPVFMWAKMAHCPKRHRPLGATITFLCQLRLFDSVFKGKIIFVLALCHFMTLFPHQKQIWSVCFWFFHKRFEKSYKLPWQPFSCAKCWGDVAPSSQTHNTNIKVVKGSIRGAMLW